MNPFAIPDGFTFDGYVEPLDISAPAPLCYGLKFKYRLSAYASKAERDTSFTADTKQQCVAGIVASHASQLVAIPPTGDPIPFAVKPADILKWPEYVPSVMLSFISGQLAPHKSGEEEAGK